jgi:hypothetical protein
MKKIFIGGAYSCSEEMKKKIAKRAKIIENVIVDCGFIYNKNFLSDPRIHENKPKADHVNFQNGESFIDAGNKAIKEYTMRTKELVRGLRYYPENDTFDISLKATSIALRELKQSDAAIFELSATTQGSFGEIFLMLYHFQRPVLALTHKDFGNLFGTMLTGSPSVFLQTKQYDDSNLEEIIRTYLLTDLPSRKIQKTSVLLPVFLHKDLKRILAKENKSMSEVIRELVENYVSQHIK